MTIDEAIAHGKEQLEVFGGEHAEFIKLAIKALEQESVLDKVRAEIADLDDTDYDYEGYYKAVTDALQIIDKYKAESEVQKNDDR